MGGNSTTSTTKTEIPAEIRQRGTQITNQAMREYMPASYTPQNRNAATNPGYAQAQGAYAQAGQSWQPWQSQAASTAQGASAHTAQGVSGPDYSTAAVQGFMNPYLEAKTQPQLAEMERQRQIAKVADNDKAAAAGAFGGARHGVADSLTNEGFDRARTAYLGQEYSDAFNNAQGQYNTNFTQGLQANAANNAAAGQNFNQGMTYADFLSGQGQNTFNNQNTTADKQLGLTNTLQGLDQAAIDRNVEESRYAQDYGLGIYERLQALNAMQPTNRTSTATQPSNPLGTALYAAGSIIPMFSDARVKEDVEDLDPERVLGAFAELPSKTYRYKDELEEAWPGERTGFMAQDYERIFRTPSAEIGGVKTIDVPQLLGRLAVAVKGLEARTRKPKRKAA